MANDTVTQSAADLAAQFNRLAVEAQGAAREAADLASRTTATAIGEQAADPLLIGLTVLVLAGFVGYYVVSKVTPALHAPLMSVTNAISGIVIVGAMVSAGPEIFGGAKLMGFAAVVLATINIFGGYIITQRMLDMYKKKR